MMDLREAIDVRHAIRAYTDEPVDPDALDTLQADIEAWNAESGLHMQMAVGLDDAFLGLKTHYGRFKGVHNAIALIGSAASVEREMRIERLRARRRATEQGDAKSATADDATGVDVTGDASTVEPNRASTLQALKETDASGEAVSAVDAALQEKVGYYGEHLVLRAVQLGLATSWAVLDDADTVADPWWRLEDGESVVWVIAFGHGARPGGRRRSKPMTELASVARGAAGGDVADGAGAGNGVASSGIAGDDVSASESTAADGDADTLAGAPEWFVRGMEAAMAAPTSLSQQPFHFTLNEDGSVTAEALRGLFSHVGLGCAKCHFEIGAAPHAVTWRAV